MEYETATAFASVYWASLLNFDLAVHVGKYLAKDVGATLVKNPITAGWLVSGRQRQMSLLRTLEGSFDKDYSLKFPSMVFWVRLQDRITPRIGSREMEVNI